ncbi:hypothetical protein [Blastopirellula retiformator]|uniref:hypothetical protein n=1 Tax=Blastopirellula retiformator TaxID=2527970 RepID=UPI0011B5DC20|nr:hypothetical protein [Blastopirellula retiformator]
MAKVPFAVTPTRSVESVVVDSSGDPRSKVMDTPASSSPFTTVLASLLKANQLRDLSVAEYDVLVARLSGEIFTNDKVREILKERAKKAMKELRE